MATPPSRALSPSSQATGGGRSAGGARASWCMTSARATVVEDYTPSPRDATAVVAYGGKAAEEDGDDGVTGLLTLKAGQTLTVLAQSDDGWWAGALDGRLGRFPARCVRLLNTPRGAPPLPVPPRPSPRAASSYAGSEAPPASPSSSSSSSRPVPPTPLSSSSTSVGTRALPKPPSPRPTQTPSPPPPSAKLSPPTPLSSSSPLPPPSPSATSPSSSSSSSSSPSSSTSSPPPLPPFPSSSSSSSSSGGGGASAAPSPPSGGPGIDKESRMRREVINEIIRTEQDYIHDLEIVINLFMMPLRMSNILPDGDINTVFSNIQLLLGVNKEFNENLSKKASDLSAANIPIGDVFARLADYFKMYTIYCANHPTAVETKIKLAKKNTNFRKFLALAESDAACRGLNLNDYLIKPVQRICKYPLFLRELVKYTPESHEDYPQLSLAERKIGEVVSYINQGARQAAARDQVVKIHSYFEGVELISPTRRLVREGLMTLIRGKEKTSVWVWLFNDLVLLGRPKQSKYLDQSKRKTHCFTPVARIGLGEVRLVNLSSVEGVEAFELQMVEKDGMKVTKVKESYVLGLPTVEQKTEWMFGLKNIIKHFQQMEFAAEKKKAESEPRPDSPTVTPRVLTREISVFDLVKQTGTSAEEEGKLATIDVYFGGVGLIAPGRRLVRDTQMVWLSGKSKDRPVEVWVWLFTDLLLVGKPKKQKHLKESHRKASCFSSVAKIGLDELRLINLASLHGHEAFEVEHVEKDGMTVVKVKETYTLGLSSTEAKMEWVLSINKLVKEFMQKDLLHEKRKRVNEGEASPLSPRKSGSIIHRGSSPLTSSSSSSSSPRGSEILSRSRSESQPLEDSEVMDIDSLFGGVALMAPGRHLVREGPVTWLNSKNKDKVCMWLLTDVILIGKPKKPKYMRKDMRKPSCFHLLANIGLDEMKLVNMGTVDGLEAFEIRDVEKEGVLTVRIRERFTVGAIASDARDWVADIKNSLKHFQLQEVSAERARAELEKEGVEAEIERKKGGSFIIRQRQRKDSISNLPPAVAVSEEKKGFFGWKRSMSSPRLVPPAPSLAAIPSPASTSALGRNSLSREDFQATTDDDDDDDNDDSCENGETEKEAMVAGADDQDARNVFVADERPLPPTPALVPPRPKGVASYSVSSVSMPDLPRVEEVVASPPKKITSLFLDDFGPRAS